MFYKFFNYLIHRKNLYKNRALNIEIFKSFIRSTLGLSQNLLPLLIKSFKKIYEYCWRGLQKNKIINYIKKKIL